MRHRPSRPADGPTRFIVSYDICHPKRLRKVHKVMKGFGEALQYSVFSCDLTAAERVRCETALRDVIDVRVDQVLFIDIGPSRGRALMAVESVGLPYQSTTLRAIVV